jgi:trans-2,3-dihydro-3-hydroxyanthranilate isomerase
LPVPDSGNLIDGGSSRKMVLEEGIGPIHCATDSIDSGFGRARFELTQLPEEVGKPANSETIAAALGLNTNDIGFDTFKPWRWSAGVPITFVPVRTLDAIRRCQANMAQWDTAFGQDKPGIAYLFCRETIEAGSSYHARMFAPRLGVPEDPATGAGAAAFSGVYLHFQDPPDGYHELFI